MFISKAFAQGTDSADMALAAEPSMQDALISTIGLPLLVLVLFYFLLIMPQQRRFKQHSNMLSQLKKGDKVVTGGGLVGKIDKVVDEKEVVVDLGNGLKVTALRSTIQSIGDSALLAANDTKPDDKKPKDGKTSKDEKSAAKAEKSKKK